MVRSVRPSMVRFATTWLSDAETAEDAVQDVLCKLWVIRSRLSAVRSFEALTRVMLRNRLVSILRKAHFATVSIDGLSEEEEPCEGDEASADLEEVLRLVRALPPLQQSILMMRHADGLEVEEIARLIDSSPDAIRANLSRARRRVKQQFLAKQQHEQD